MPDSWYEPPDEGDQITCDDCGNETVSRGGRYSDLCDNCAREAWESDKADRRLAEMKEYR